MATYYGTLKSRSVDDPTATTAHQICTNNWPKRGHITSEKPFKVEVSGTTVTISSNGSATSSTTWTLINYGMILTVYWNNSPVFTKSVSGASYHKFFLSSLRFKLPQHCRWAIILFYYFVLYIICIRNIVSYFKLCASYL